MKAIKWRALDIAREQIGNGETDQNNCGKDVEMYLQHMIETPANWCAAFVSWCYMMAGENEEMPFKYSLSARGIYNQFTGSPLIKVTTPRAGDLIFFWRGHPDSWMGHVGFVENIVTLNRNFYIGTIEGNRGVFPSKVKRYSYPLNNVPQLLGYGRVQNTYKGKML